MNINFLVIPLWINASNIGKMLQKIYEEDMDGIMTPLTSMS